MPPLSPLEEWTVIAVAGLSIQARSQAVSRLCLLAMVWGLVAVVMVAPILLDITSLADTYYYPKARALYVLAPVLALTWLLRAFLTRGSVDGRILSPALAFSVAAIAATVGSVDPAWSLTGAPWRREGLLTLLAYSVIFVTAATAFTPALVHRWLAATLLGATAVAAYGIAQYFGFDWLVRDAQRVDWWWAFSTTGNHMFMGAYMVLAVPLAIAFILTAQSTLPLIFGTACLTLIYLAALFTYSRAAWAALAVALGILSLLAVRLRRSIPVRRYLFALLLLAVLAAIFVIPHGPLAPRPEGISPLLHVRSIDDGSVRSRPYLWKQTLRLLLQRPWLGYGPEALPLVFPQEWDEAKRQIWGDLPLKIDKAHNDTLDMAMSIGIVGLAAFWWVVGAALKRAWHASCSGGPQAVLGMACLAGIIAYLADLQFQFSVISVAPVFWSMLGVAAALGRTGSSEADDEKGRRHRAFGNHHGDGPHGAADGHQPPPAPELPVEP